MADSKYQKILIDESPSSTIPTAKANITVEEWYDMLHHSHPEFQNMSNNGNSTTGNEGGNNQDLSEIIAAISNLTTLVEQQGEKINSVIDINNSQTESINTMKSQIDKLEAYVDQDIQIDDDGTE